VSVGGAATREARTLSRERRCGTTGCAPSSVANLQIANNPACTTRCRRLARVFGVVWGRPSFFENLSNATLVAPQKPALVDALRGKVAGKNR
jgi:hypothetical protein